MSAKHTPGPWALELIQKWPFGVRVTSGDELIFSASAVCHSTKQITRRDCELGVGFDEHASNPEFRADTARAFVAAQDANARLISAAPEMHAEMLRYLPLLERAEADPELWAKLTEGLGIATLNGYRAAISKATGGEA